jgi:hypothetical protein
VLSGALLFALLPVPVLMPQRAVRRSCQRRRRRYRPSNLGTTYHAQWLCIDNAVPLLLHLLPRLASCRFRCRSASPLAVRGLLLDGGQGQWRGKENGVGNTNAVAGAGKMSPYESQ